VRGLDIAVHDPMAASYAGCPRESVAPHLELDIPQEVPLHHDIALHSSRLRRRAAAGMGPVPRSWPARFLGLAAAAFALACVLVSPARALDIVPGFVVDNAVPGPAFDLPVCIKFLPDGRLLVLEKAGRLWVVKNGVRHPVPMWSATNEVLSNDDRGALGLEVDPGFATNHYLYLLYTVDPDSDGVDTNDEAFGRLVRYRVSASDSNALDLSTRTVLLGRDWAHGPLVASSTHTIGSLQFAPDGSLLVSVGEGAQFNTADAGGHDPNGFLPGRTDPAEDIGAFRSQYLGSLCGKLLRLNPADGHGYPSNPFWDGDPTSVRSRVWAYGLRNPYRITIRPGTGSTNPAAGNPGAIYIGDVGWGDTEELDIADGPGRNFAWPCYEGAAPRNDYQAASPPIAGCGTFGTPANPSLPTLPVARWDHGDPAASVPPGAIGRTSIGGAFYTGNQYPAAYRGRYFHGEFTFGWIKVATMDSTNHVVSLATFADFAGGPVDIEADPVSGDIFYVSIYGNEVRRIRYTGGSGGNTPPVANASADPVVGVAPMQVAFSSAGSSDVDGDPLAFVWNFGDGAGSTSPNPTHLYATAGTYDAVLAVTDTTGASDTTAVQVVVSESFGFPTTGVLDDFNRADGPVGGAWAGGAIEFTISDSTLAPVPPGGSAVWDGAVFGPDQEARVTITSVTGFGERALMLKVQGLSGSDGHIEVRYDPDLQQVHVNTFAPGQGWQARGGPWPIALAAGDRLGARARANGLVELFVNGSRLATTSVGNWPFASSGGRVGLTIAGGSGLRLDDFGGGSAVLAFNTPPAAGIDSPVDSTFFVTGETIALMGHGSDAEQPATTLAYRWDVDLHHNVHVHPGVVIIPDSTGSFVAENHEDGSGVWLQIRFAVTDAGGLADTARVSIFPEVDLSPTFPWVQGGVINTTDPAVLHFWVSNLGRMPAPRSRWRLTAEGAGTLAEGDTLVPALDSVLVTCTVAPVLAAGPHVLRVTADTLSTVVETAEGNNGRSGTVIVGTGTTGVFAAPARLRLSGAFPNPAIGAVSWSLELPRAARLDWSVHDVAGREVWREPGGMRDAGRWVLRWGGSTDSGRPVPAGVYLVRVRVDGTEFTRRFAILR
jgi:glucose/arabinose dehydrogenase